MVEAKFGNQIEDVLHFEVSVGWRRQYCGIKITVLNGVTFYFIDNQYYFFRGHVYGDFDDGERFAFFQLAAIEAMERIDFIPAKGAISVSFKANSKQSPNIPSENCPWNSKL